MEGVLTPMQTVTTALTEGITTIATDALSAIGSIIPVALPIAGAVIVVTIGLRVFKKVGK
jgi:hypothetical protein